jgi:hypothetical protein
VTGPGEGSDALRDADRLYSARSAMAGVAAERGSVGIAELVRFLTVAGSELPPEAQRALFASQRLRADFQRLKRRLRIVDLPEVAAASTGGIASRTFAGGSVRVHPSRMEGQVYMVFQFREFAGTPAALLLEDASNRVAKRPLPAPDALGQAVLVLDRSNPGDELFLQLFADPQTTGSFLAQGA